MKQCVIVQYDFIKNTVSVKSELSTFETFGVLEAARVMIANDWVNDPDNERDDT